MRELLEVTPARIGLVRAGASMATREVLKFDWDHARARDAVHLPFDTEEVARQLEARRIEFLKVRSAAADRGIYLQRPDLGRRLDASSRQLLQNHCPAGPREFDLGLVIADGLSTRAIHRNAIAFLDQFLALERVQNWRRSPVVIASQARVAIADEICEILNTRMGIILIGERPGLSASDSMGIYLTYAPRKGRTDAERNCLSNIRPGGLDCRKAARQLESLIDTAFRRCLSGVHLKQP